MFFCEHNSPSEQLIEGCGRSSNNQNHSLEFGCFLARAWVGGLKARLWSMLCRRACWMIRRGPSSQRRELHYTHKNGSTGLDWSFLSWGVCQPERVQGNPPPSSPAGCRNGSSFGFNVLAVLFAVNSWDDFSPPTMFYFCFESNYIRK